MTREEKYLRNMFLFSDLTDEEYGALEDIRSNFTKLSFEAGVKVHLPCNSIYLLESGKAEIVTANTPATILKKLKEGDVFNAGAVYSGKECETLIFPRTQIRLISVPRESIDRIIEKNHRAAISYISLLSEKISFLNEKITTFTAGEAESKVILYLRELMKSGTEEDSCIKARMNDSCATLAKKLNMGRASLYRIFDGLEKDGIILKNGTEITFLMPERIAHSDFENKNHAEVSSASGKCPEERNIYEKN